MGPGGTRDRQTAWEEAPPLVVKCDGGRGLRGVGEGGPVLLDYGKGGKNDKATSLCEFSRSPATACE